MGQTLAFPVHPAWKAGMAGPMPAHQRMPWKPVPLPHNPALDVDVQLGQVTPGAVKAVAFSALIPVTAIAAATAYVGFRLGAKDEGVPSILGYIVGALAGITAITGLLAMLGMAVTPINFMQTPPATGPQTTTTAA
jgi:hypothetical protein